MKMKQNEKTILSEKTELPPIPEPDRIVDEKRDYTTSMAFLILGVALILLIGTKQVIEVKFEPEIITQGLIVKNNIQAAHSVFSVEELSELILSAKFQGNSMQPTIFEGNTAMMMQYTEDYEIIPGEIIMYSRLNTDGSCPNFRNSVGVVHRVIATYEDNMVLVQGDNVYEQEYITKCQISHIIIGVLFT